MFNSIVDAPPLWSTGKLKSGATLSVLAHLGVVAAVIGLQSFTSHVVEPLKEPTVVFRAGPRPPKGNPPAAAASAVTPPPKPKKRTMTPPKVIQPLPLTPPPPVETVAAASTNAPVPGLPTLEGADPNGVETGGVPGAKPGPGGGGSAEDVVPFGEGMVKPQLLAAGNIRFTREALEARVQGVVIARCVVTTDGDVRDCKIIKGVPLMNEAVLQGLHERKYTPITFQGRPISVLYTFTVKLELP